MKKNILLLLFLPTLLFSQNNTSESKLNFNGDFRFRIEEDWNSRKADGSYRTDRSRLRYRARFGATYAYSDFVSFGMNLRTGQANKQQDPQITLGDSGDASVVPIGFEKIYTQFKYKGFTSWIGKNTFTFEKQNELFWSDNVFPEGIALSKILPINHKWIDKIELKTGHFILKTNNKSFAEDSYFEGFQMVSSHFNNKLKLFPSLA